MKQFLFVLIIVAITMGFALGCGSSAGTKDSTPTSTLTTPIPITSPGVSATASTPAASITPDYDTPIPQTPPSLPELKVHYIDVGQGDSILCDLGETEVLIDGSFQRMSPVEYLLDYVDGPLEVMVATSVEADYIGGLISILEFYEVEEIWHNGDTSTSWTYDRFMDRVQSEGAEVHVARLHDRIMAGGLSFYVMNPGELSDDINRNSIVLHMEYGEIDFLFMGNAQQESEGEMIAQSSIAVPKIEILKVGDHASKAASSMDFMNITRPEVAIYSCQIGNWYGHPHEETIARLRNIGADIYGTDVHGTIIVTTNGNRYTIQHEEKY